MGHDTAEDNSLLHQTGMVMATVHAPCSSHLCTRRQRSQKLNGDKCGPNAGQCGKFRRVRVARSEPKLTAELASIGAEEEKMRVFAIHESTKQLLMEHHIALAHWLDRSRFDHVPGECETSAHHEISATVYVRALSISSTCHP